MLVFLVPLCAGLGGLALMAVPALRRHGRAAKMRAARGRQLHTGRVAHGHAHTAARGTARSHAARSAAKPARVAAPKAGGHSHSVPGAGRQPSRLDGVLHVVPEPRVVFTLLALFGAFGNVLEAALHLPVWAAALGALGIASALEWLVVGRLWRLTLGFGGEPSSPLEMLLMDRAQAVTPFHNGRGIVRVVRDGRSVQLAAELTPEQQHATIRVGDELTILEVDSEHERVVVSLV